MKSFGVVFTVILFGFAGLITTIIAWLSRDAEFYVPFVIVNTIGLITFIIWAIYGHLKNKRKRIIMIVFFILSIFSVSGYEAFQTYLKSLEIVSTQDVDLSDYQPFVENTKAVVLDEEATFKIDTNLPKLDGATALYPVYSAFVQAVYPEKDYSLEDSEVISSQTMYAFDHLLSGGADIVFMAHPSENQMKSAEELGVELTLNPIGREAFVFFVHSENSVSELTIEEIKGIYSGEITNWKELGGKDEEIRAFQRPEESGSQSALINLMDGTRLMEPPSENIASAMGGIITEVTNYRNQTNAIGFSFRHFSQDMVQNGKIKYIAVEGVTPTKESIQNDSYPIVAPFYAVTAKSSNPYVDDFVKWMQSAQGQKIVDMTGYVPLK